jgi:hypothetical protein
MSKNVKECQRMSKNVKDCQLTPVFRHDIIIMDEAYGQLQILIAKSISFAKEYERKSASANDRNGRFSGAFFMPGNKKTNGNKAYGVGSAPEA